MALIFKPGQKHLLRQIYVVAALGGITIVGSAALLIKGGASLVARDHKDHTESLPVTEGGS
jgi:hypothetical protein